tara:strand:- start:18 stop:698 length:681 start_codon:yes stop_codon:yes gene_type:complete
MGIKSQFCPKCGTETDKLVEGLCANCYSGELKIKFPRSKNLLVCVKCKHSFFKNFWTETSREPESILAERIMESIKLPEGEKMVSFNLIETGKQGSAEVVTEKKGEHFTRKIKGRFEIVKYCCPACSREQGIDYTAKLQLRDKDNPKKFVEEALKYIRAATPKISKVEPMLHGADVHLVNQRLARQAARRIQKHLKCTSKASFRNYGWDKEEDRPKRRITILLKRK